ncbi:MAG: carbonic anhydrase [Nannocystales bacterium]
MSGFVRGCYAALEMSIEQTLQRLEAGNARFVADKLDGKLQDSARRTALTSGQAPDAIILSCADSRVVPEFAFDAGLGELFVIRVAGNIANTSSVASIEYAVANLKTSVIVVLGHESCGAVTAAIAGGDNGPNLNTLLGYIQPAKEKAASEDVNDVVRANASHVAADLVSKSEIIRKAVESGSVRIVPAFYELGTGAVKFLS